MKTLFVLCIALVGLVVANADQDSDQISLKELEVRQCYKRYPFLLSQVALVTDREFADPIQSTSRKTQVSLELQNSKTQLVFCMQKMNDLAKESNDQVIIDFVSTRLKEFKDELNGSPSRRQARKD